MLLGINSSNYNSNNNYYSINNNNTITHLHNTPPRQHQRHQFVMHQG